MRNDYHIYVKQARLRPVYSALLKSILLYLWLATGITGTATADESEYQLALEDADIRELARWASDQTGKSIIIHPDVQGKVTVLAGAPVSKEEAYGIFLSILELHGYAVIQTNDSLNVVPAPLANTKSVISDNGSIDRQDLVVKIVRVNSMPANHLLNILKPLVSKNALITASPESNLLILSDRADNIERLTAIINRIDTADIIDIEVVPVNYASAGDIKRIIAELLPDVSSQGSTNPRSFKLTVDPRSNSLLMTGDELVRKQVRRLINRLDQPQAGEGNTQVIFVNYSRADTLLPILKSISGDYNNRANVDNASQDIDVQIEVNNEINALVITAPESLLSKMKTVITQLDVRRAQVLVEAIIVEVNDKALRKLGVEWQTNIAENGAYSGFNALPSGMKALEPPALGQGLTLGFFSNAELRGVIRALEATNAANILSAPTVVALDNEEAEILVGANVPFITGQSTGVSSSTTNPFQTIERHDIGITLKILPRINNDDSITLQVQQTVESIVPAEGTTSDIITNKRNITTKVLIEDNEVLVLGGLMDDKVTTVEKKVPVLGDIPLLGRLFRSTSTDVSKQNLMVFIHPQILRSTLQKDVATRHYYENFRQIQNDSGRDNNIFSIARDKHPQLPELDKRARLPLIKPSIKRQKNSR